MYICTSKNLLTLKNSCSITRNFNISGQKSKIRKAKQVEDGVVFKYLYYVPLY